MKNKPISVLTGFAKMDPDRLRQVASLGGRAAHECGRANQFTSEEAREAARSRWEQRPAKRVALPAEAKKTQKKR